MSLSSFDRIIFHCGLHKTASSYIQRVLNSNVERLAERGIHFPTIRAGNHSVIAINYSPEVPLDKLFSRFVKLDSPCRTLLISGEEFSRQPANDGFLNALVEAAPNAKIEFLFYLRRVDHLRESVYAESVKNRLYGDIEKSAYQFDYWATLKPFLEVVGKENIIIRPYNPEKWPDGSYGADFFQALGLADLWQTMELPKDRVNASLSRQETFLLSRLRSRAAKTALRAYFEQAPIASASDQSKYFLSPDQRQHFRNLHAQSTQQVGDLFDIADMQEFLGDEPDALDSQWTPYEPDWEMLFKYLAGFLDEQHEPKVPSSTP